MSIFLVSGCMLVAEVTTERTLSLPRTDSIGWCYGKHCVGPEAPPAMERVPRGNHIRGAKRPLELLPGLPQAAYQIKLLPTTSQCPAPSSSGYSRLITFPQTLLLRHIQQIYLCIVVWFKLFFLIAFLWQIIEFCTLDFQTIKRSAISLSGIDS